MNVTAMCMLVFDYELNKMILLFVEVIRSRIIYFETSAIFGHYNLFHLLKPLKRMCV